MINFKNQFFLILIIFTIIVTTPQVNASLLGHGCCQAICNATWASCYAVAGFTAGKYT